MAVVFARWAHTDDLTTTHSTWLDRHERKRCARLRHRGDQERFVLGSALLRTLIAELEDTVPSQVALDRACHRCGDQHGPVTLPGRRWSCSVTHSGSYAVAAAVASTSCNAIGVDLETHPPRDWVDLLPRVLAPGEVPPEREADFLRLWVRKEAVLKATGHGLALPMTSVDLSRDSEAHLAGDPASFGLLDLDLGPLRASGLNDAAAAAVAVDSHRFRVQWERRPL